MKKAWNILGIFFAWILSILLVVMLIAAPLALSALSLLEAKTVTNVITDALTAGSGLPEPQASAEEVRMVRLSDVSQTQAPVDAEGILTEIFGDDMNKDQLDAILSSKVVKEFVETYTEDLTAAFVGGAEGAQFNAEKVKAIVNDNMDEIVDILQEVVPECADMDKAELVANIQKAMDENAEALVQALPKPQEIRDEIAKSSPELELVFQIIAKKNALRLAIIGAIVLISALIFLCRLCGFRGFRWLAVDLFVGAGFGGVFCAALLVGVPMLKESMADNAIVSGLVGSLMSAFTTGMIVRTVVMLVSGGVLLAGYIILKKHRAKKAQAEEMQLRQPQEAIENTQPIQE